MQHITQIGLRDPVHTNPEKFESEALFLPSILIRPENDAWCHDNQVICDCCVAKPLRGSVDKNYLMRF